MSRPGFRVCGAMTIDQPPPRFDPGGIVGWYFQHPSYIPNTADLENPSGYKGVGTERPIEIAVDEFFRIDWRYRALTLEYNVQVYNTDPEDYLIESYVSPPIVPHIEPEQLTNSGDEVSNAFYPGFIYDRNAVYARILPELSIVEGGSVYLYLELTFAGGYAHAGVVSVTDISQGKEPNFPTEITCTVLGQNCQLYGTNPKYRYEGTVTLGPHPLVDAQYLAYEGSEGPIYNGDTGKSLLSPAPLGL